VAGIIIPSSCRPILFRWQVLLSLPVRGAEMLALSVFISFFISGSLSAPR
jgi:hypothetical protein